MGYSQYPAIQCPNPSLPSPFTQSTVDSWLPGLPQVSQLEGARSLQTIPLLCCDLGSPVQHDSQQLGTVVL